MRLSSTIAAILCLTNVYTYTPYFAVHSIQGFGGPTCNSFFRPCAVDREPALRCSRTLRLSGESQDSSPLSEEYELVRAGEQGWTVRALTYGDEVRRSYPHEGTNRILVHELKRCGTASPHSRPCPPLAGGQVVGETFHPGIGPEAEALGLYVAQLRMPERARAHCAAAAGGGGGGGGDGFVVWDVGLGAAANAIVAARELARAGCPRVTVVSFDRTLGPCAHKLVSYNFVAIQFFFACGWWYRRPVLCRPGPGKGGRESGRG